MIIEEIRGNLGINTGDCLEVDLHVEEDGLREYIKVKGNVATLGFLLNELFVDLVNNPDYTLRTRRKILEEIRYAADCVKVKEDKNDAT